MGLGATSNGDTTHYPLLENILFENNGFKETTGPAVEAGSFKNLVIRNNSISASDADGTIRASGDVDKGVPGNGCRRFSRREV